jgi:hypothetical protein
MNPECNKLKTLLGQLTRTPPEVFPFPRKKLYASTQKGVYVIYSPTNVVVHVGSTPWARKGIAQRLRDHMAGNSSFTINYLKGAGHKLRGKYKYRCLVVPSGRQRALLEAFAIGHLCPRHIGHGRDRRE